jgi:hypothetical protein
MPLSLSQILQITLYARRKSTTVNAKPGIDVPYGRRLNKVFDPADVNSILIGEFENRKGKMMVSGKILSVADQQTLTVA